MPVKSRLVPFSPVYEPIVRERYVNDYLRSAVSGIGGVHAPSGSLADTAAVDFMAQYDALGSAPLFFARSDMVTLAVAAMLDGDVPDVAPPSESGFLLLEGGVTPVGVTRRNVMRVYGLVWFPSPIDGLGVNMLPDVMMPHLGVRVPVRRTRRDVNAPRDVADYTNRKIRGNDQMHALLNAMWALWEQPRVIETKQARSNPLDRVSAKVIEQAKYVRVMDVREHDESDMKEHSDTGRRNRPYDHRFIVSGHWREQPCGQGRSQRRRTWIAPFVKGPADKPLIVKDVVRVWRG